MVHELKIWPVYYARVRDGSKTFEVRKNDRDFQSGDTVVLKEYQPAIENCPGHYTQSEELIFKIGYVCFLNSDMVVFSLLGDPRSGRLQN